jgi:CRP-like cAMP-binding protein
MDKLLLLKSVSVFGGLEEALLSKIVGHLQESKTAAGQEIFAQDQKADSFFIIDSGDVVISRRIGPGQEKVLAVLNAGGVFGEMAFFADSPRTATATAKSDTLLWKIERNDFMKFVSDEPQAGLRILSALLQVSMDRLEQTSQELATIYQTGKIISTGGSLRKIFKAILEQVLLAVPSADNGAAYIYNEFNDEFDPAEAPAGAAEICVKCPIIETVKVKPEGLLLNSAKEVGQVEEDFFSGMASLIAAPIFKEGKLLGFILLWSAKPGAFRNSQLLLASAVSSQLADAIENIKHHQEELDRQRLKKARDTY